VRKIYGKPTIALTIIKTILAHLPAVRQPQPRFLDTLFATILALGEPVNFRNLPRYCLYSERTIQRQFRGASTGLRFIPPRSRRASFFKGCGRTLGAWFGNRGAGLREGQARDAKVLDSHFNASWATLNLVRESEVPVAATQPLQVCSLASWKQHQFKERLLETLMTKLDLEPTLIKKHPRYEGNQDLQQPLLPDFSLQY
jgi:hypothetical protein